MTKVAQSCAQPEDVRGLEHRADIQNLGLVSHGSSVQHRKQWCFTLQSRLLGTQSPIILVEKTSK